MLFACRVLDLIVFGLTELFTHPAIMWVIQVIWAKVLVEVDLPGTGWKEYIKGG